MSSMYKRQKEDFDNKVFAYLVKRLREPVTDTDAFHMGIVDEMGNQVKQTTPETKWACTDLDRLLFFLKTAMGDKFAKITSKYDNMDSLSIMSGRDIDTNSKVYDRVIALVEELAYLPPENRGEGQYIEESEEGLTREMRLQRAFTCAQFLMACIINNGTVASENVMDFDRDVLDAVESTFNIRGVGTYKDITDYLKAGKAIDYASVKTEGYVLAVRIAKTLVKANDTIFNPDRKDELNETSEWRALASYER